MDLSGFNVTIVGIGLLGGSLAMALKDLNANNVWGVDNNSDVLDYALEKGLIDRGYINPKDPLEESDMVIICIYPEGVNEFLSKHIDDFKKGAIITDIAGIKTSISEFAEKFPREDIDIICGHPMAGNEHCGIKSATNEIFKNASYIFTPLARNKIENLELMEKLVSKIGFGTIIRVTPQEHDRIIALTSHIPHIMAVAIINSAPEDADLRPFTGGSYRDSTRVALINSELWTQLIMQNKNNVLWALDMIEESLDQIRKAVEVGDCKKLSENLETARKRRKSLLNT